MIQPLPVMLYDNNARREDKAEGMTVRARCPAPVDYDDNQLAMPPYFFCLAR